MARRATKCCTGCGHGLQSVDACPFAKDHAHARVIAAAEDLYEAARDAEALLKSIEGQHPAADELLRRVRAALAKARGES